jgi:quinol monooxygenase YgiN
VTSGEPASGVIHVWAEFEVRPGNEDAFRAVCRRMTELVRASEPGMLDYQWYFSDDGSICHAYERVADEEALGAHGHSEAVRIGIPQLLALGRFSRFEVHGDLSAATSDYMRGVGAVIYRP